MCNVHLASNGRKLKVIDPLLSFPFGFLPVGAGVDLTCRDSSRGTRVPFVELLDDVSSILQVFFRFPRVFRTRPA